MQHSLHQLAAKGEAKSTTREVYWNNALPKTSMPRAIKDLLMPKTSIVHVTNHWQNAGDSRMVNDRNITLFFVKKDLHSGNKMNLSFPDATVYRTEFITQQAATSIPFAASKLPEILNRFSIKPDSQEAEAMKDTLTDCEARAMDGEIKFCATSLESMIKFSTSTIGTSNVYAISTTADRKNSPKEQYEITSKVLEKTNDDDTVVCHAQAYAYAVYYCHKLKGVEVYKVKLVGMDGTKVDAVATCHTDTSSWNPKHVALQLLKVKPGTVPVCHFLPQYDVVWLPRE